MLVLSNLFSALHTTACDGSSFLFNSNSRRVVVYSPTSTHTHTQHLANETGLSPFVSLVPELR